MHLLYQRKLRFQQCRIYCWQKRFRVIGLRIYQGDFDTAKELQDQTRGKSSAAGAAGVMGK